MNKVLFFFSLFFLVHFDIYAQLNVELLHQLVSESKSENQRQSTAKNKQVVTTANEEVNKVEMSKFKTKYREIQSRFKILGTAFDATQIGLQATPVVNNIIQQQARIFELARDNPLLIVLAYDVEVNLAEQAHLLVNYMYGLFLSVGDLNQMKASDRKMLFNYLISELRKIESTSRGLANSMQYFILNKTKAINPFGQYFSQERGLVDDIFRKYEILKTK